MSKGKDALLLWCKKCCDGYKDVSITNFTYSFKDGLAFCAIVHRYHPEAFDYDKQCKKSTPYENHDLAFTMAEKYANVPRLLDPEDFIDLPKPDRLSVITYVSELYHGLKGSGGARKFGLQQVSAADIEPPSNKKSTKQNKRKSAEITKPAQAPTPKKPASVKAMLARPCAKCGKPLSGTVAEWEGVAYHTACFGCWTCSKPLRSECINIDGKPYCDVHGKEAFLASRKAKQNQNTSKPTPTLSNTAKRDENKANNTSSSPSAAAKSAGSMIGRSLNKFSNKLKSQNSADVAKPTVKENKPLPKPALSPTPATKPTTTTTTTTSSSVSSASASNDDMDFTANIDPSLPLWKRKRLEAEARQKAAADAETLRKQQKINEMFGKSTTTTSSTTSTSKPSSNTTAAAANKPKSSLVERMKQKKQQEAEEKKKKEAEVKAKAEQEKQARLEQERKEKIDAERRQREETERLNRVKQEKQAQLKREQQLKEKAEAEEKRKKEEAAALIRRMTAQSQAKSPELAKKKALPSPPQEDTVVCACGQSMLSSATFCKQCGEPLARSSKKSVDVSTTTNDVKVDSNVNKDDGPPPALPRKKETSKCALCQKTVFAREKIVHDGQAYHRACWRCAECGISSRVSVHDDFSVVDGRVVCRAHAHFDANAHPPASPQTALRVLKPDEKPDWAGALRKATGDSAPPSSTVDDEPIDESLPEWKKTMLRKERERSATAAAELAAKQAKIDSIAGVNKAGAVRAPSATVSVSSSTGDVFDAPPDAPPPLPGKKSRADRPPTTVIKNFTPEQYQSTLNDRRQSMHDLKLPNMPEEPLEGYLLKKGDVGIIKQWKKRLFVLKEDCVVYYRDNAHKRAEVVQGLIPLRNCTVCMTPQATDLCFQINSPGRIWLLQGESVESAQKWLKALEATAIRATVEDEEESKPQMLSRESTTRSRRHAAAKEGLVHVMQGTNNSWRAQWLSVKDGVLSVHETKKDRAKLKIPLYHCGIAEYDPEHPPPNLGIDFFGSLRKLVSKTEVTDFRHSFQVCGANRSIVIQTTTEEEMHLWLNNILAHKVMVEAVIDSIEIDLW